MDNLSRRTNILAGNDVLTTIAPKNITTQNGIMTINVTTLENPVKIGGIWLRDSGGKLETSLDGSTWTGIGGTVDLTPYALKTDLQAHINDATVHGGGGTPTAYALAWNDGTAIFSRQAPGAWLNGNLQIWMRVYLPDGEFFWFSDVWITNALGGVFLTSCDRFGDISDYLSGTPHISNGWHNIALQWTAAAFSCILYVDGAGGTPFAAYKRTLDAATNYDIKFQATGLKVAALVMSDQLTWNATTAAKDTIGTPLFSLPLTEGSGATATDSTGTAWTIPAGVVWEAV